MTLKNTTEDGFLVVGEFFPGFAQNTICSTDNNDFVQNYCSEELIPTANVLEHALSFGTCNCLIENSIDSMIFPNGSMFNLNYPQGSVLRPCDYQFTERTLKETNNRIEVILVVDRKHMNLDLQPAYQKMRIISVLDGDPLPGMQRKYRTSFLLSRHRDNPVMILPSKTFFCDAGLIAC